jgi:hypothetical protein
MTIASTYIALADLGFAALLYAATPQPNKSYKRLHWVAEDDVNYNIVLPQEARIRGK